MLKLTSTSDSNSGLSYFLAPTLDSDFDIKVFSLLISASTLSFNILQCNGAVASKDRLCMKSLWRYTRFRMLSPPLKLYASYTVHKSAYPNPLYPKEGGSSG